MLPYSREAFKALDDLAEPLDGPLVTRFAELARVVNAMAALGLARRTDTGFRISQVILSETGEVVACHEKMHFCQYGASCEKQFLERGEKMIVVGLKGWKMAPLRWMKLIPPSLLRNTPSSFACLNWIQIYRQRSVPCTLS